MSSWSHHVKGLSCHRGRLVGILCSAALLVAACAGPEVSSSPAAPTSGQATRTLVSLWIDASNPSIARETAQRFTATATFSDGVTDDVSDKVSWRASDIAPAHDVTAVDGAGLARGRSAGQATITAALDGQEASTTLTVTLAALSSLTLTPTSPSIAKGTAQAAAKVWRWATTKARRQPSRRFWASRMPPC